MLNVCVSVYFYIIWENKKNVRINNEKNATQIYKIKKEERLAMYPENT